MLSFLQHVHDCQLSIDQQAEDDAAVPCSHSEAPKETKMPTDSSPRKTNQNRNQSLNDEKKRHPKQRRAKHSIPVEVVLDKMAPISPLRNPRPKRSIPTGDRNQAPDKAKELDISITEISFDEESIGSEMKLDRKNTMQVSTTSRRNGKANMPRRTSLHSEQSRSVTSASSSILEDLELRSKGTMKSRPCYSEIKGLIAPSTPQKSPVRRFSIDNGQIGNTPDLENLSDGAEIAKDNRPTSKIDEITESPYAQKSQLSQQSPFRRTISFVPPQMCDEESTTQVRKSPMTPSKRIVLGSANLLQNLKDVYSTGNEPNSSCGQAAVTNRGKQQNTTTDPFNSPGKLPRSESGKGCLPALSPGLVSPTKTKNNPDILLRCSSSPMPDSSCNLKDRVKPENGRADSAVDSQRARTRRRSSLARGGNRNGRHSTSTTNSKTPPETSRVQRGNGDNRRHRRSSMSEATQIASRKGAHADDKRGRRSSMSQLHPAKGSPRDSTESRYDPAGQWRTTYDAYCSSSTDKVERRHRTRSKQERSAIRSLSRSREKGKDQDKHSEPRENGWERRYRRQTMSHLPQTSSRIDTGRGQEERQTTQKESVLTSSAKERRRTMAHIGNTTENALYPDKDNLREYIAQQLGEMQTFLSRAPVSNNGNEQPNGSESTSVEKGEEIADDASSENSDKRLTPVCRNSKAA